MVGLGSAGQVRSGQVGPRGAKSPPLGNLLGLGGCGENPRNARPLSRPGKGRTGCNEEGKSGSASPDHLRGKVRRAANPRAADFEGVDCQAFFTGQLSLCWRKNLWIGSLGLDNLV